MFNNCNCFEKLVSFFAVGQSKFFNAVGVVKLSNLMIKLYLKVIGCVTKFSYLKFHILSDCDK